VPVFVFFAGCALVALAYTFIIVLTTVAFNYVHPWGYTTTYLITGAVLFLLSVVRVTLFPTPKATVRDEDE